MSQFFSILSSILMASTVIIYFGQMKKGESIPNLSTWIITLFVCTLNSITYILTLEGDILKGSVTIVITTGVIMVIAYASIKGKFGRVGLVEYLSIVLASCVILVWKISDDPAIANISLQIVFVISFIPTIRGLLKHEIREKALSWSLAVMAYCLTIIALLLDLEKTPWTAFVYPIVDGVMCNGTVALIAYVQKLNSQKVLS